MIVAVAVCCFRLFPERDVTVLHDGTSLQVSAMFDVRDESLDAANVALEPGDRVVLAEGADHSSVAILRAREVTIESDGMVTTLRTQASTVEGALADAGVSLTPGDRVYINGHLTTARGPLAAAVTASRMAVRSDVLANPGEERPPSVSVAVVRARPVVVFLDENRIDIRSSAPNVYSLLTELGVTVREGDIVSPSLDSAISAGMNVRLAKGQSVSVIIDGKEHSLYTQAETVQQVLDLLGVAAGPEDQLSPPLDTPITKGMTVTLGRTIETTEEGLVPIEPAVEYRTDASLPAGTSKTVPGTPGQMKVMYQVVYRNGVEQSRVRLDGGEVLVPPVATVIVTGTKAESRPVQVANPAPAPTQAPAAAPAAAAPQAGRTLWVRATWYNESHGGKSPDDPWYGITASGDRLAIGICAVDPNVIPMGTWFYVPGYGQCKASDVGGGVKGNHVDLGFPEAMGTPTWGDQWVEITIFD